MAEKENINAGGRPEGGDILSNVKLNAKKRIRVNPDFVMPKIRIKEVDNTQKKYRCCMCGSEYSTQKGNFLTSGNSPLWKGNNGYLPFCKSCCETLMSSMTAFYDGNEEHALRHLCTIFDWYYSHRASAMTLSQVQVGRSRISIYPSKACTRQVATKGTTFLDTVRDEEAVTANTVVSKDEVVDKGAEEEFPITKEMLRAWGYGFTPDQYQYLEEEYADWTAKNVCNTKSQEEIYRNIVLAQLDIRIARERGGKIAEAQKALQDLMNSANILPKQTLDNPFAETQTFGTMLKKLEETTPVGEPAPEWRDVDGIRRYANTWFRGGLGKALRIKNENTALYDEAVEEMERYTVKRETFGNSADGMGSAMFDNESGDGNGNNK